MATPRDAPGVEEVIVLHTVSIMTVHLLSDRNPPGDDDYDDDYDDDDKESSDTDDEEDDNTV